MVKNLILVFVGGGLGSMLRFLISKINYSNLNFPIFTLFVNFFGFFFNRIDYWLWFKKQQLE